jgi:hypothetical protein
MSKIKRNEIYLYNDKYYLSLEDLEIGFDEAWGHNYNNIDISDTAEYIQTWEHEVETLNPFDWDTFKEYCTQENLNPSHAEVVINYMEAVGKW